MTGGGKAWRISGAKLRTAWSSYNSYRNAILEARKGNGERLADLITARRPLEDDDYDLLAGFIRDISRKPGNQLEELPHKVALLAVALKGVGKPLDAYLKAESEKIQRREQQIAHPDHEPIIDETLHKSNMGLIKIALETVMREVSEPVDREAVVNAALTLVRNPKRLHHK